MKKDKCNVQLKHFTPLNVALEAGLICTNSENNIDKYNAENFISKLLSNGHESVIEHINYTFVIDNISRAMLQELARHRHISLSVQSTRWALKKLANNADKMSTDIFPNKKDINYDELYAENQSYFDTIYDKYTDILDCITSLSANGIPNDILKYFLPEALTTKLMLTLNARELRLIFKLRSKTPALLEFQNWCSMVYNAIPADHKFMFSEFFNDN